MAFNTGSLFGGGGLGSSTTPQSTSLFGSNTGTSAFGNATTSAGATQGAQTSSLFGQTQPQQQQQPAQSSILGQPQQQQQQQQPVNTAQAQGGASTQGTQPAFFNSLLERGKKRPLSTAAQNGNFEDIPSLQLGLDDIRRKARELGTAGKNDTQPTSSKA